MGILSKINNFRKLIYKTPREKFESLCKTFDLFDNKGNIIKSLYGKFENEQTIYFSEDFLVKGDNYLKSSDNFFFKFIPNSTQKENYILDPSSNKPVTIKVFSVKVENVEKEEQQKIENLIANIQIAVGNNISQSNTIYFTSEQIIQEIKDLNNPSLDSLCEELKKIEIGELEIKKGMFTKYLPFLSDVIVNMIGGFLSGLLLNVIA